MRGLYLLTAKPMVYAANVAEDDLAAPDSNAYVTALRDKAAEEGSGVVVVSAQVGWAAGGGECLQPEPGCTRRRWNPCSSRFPVYASP